ncbi:MAG: Ldh family oxidoreductase [Alphaproteobacteria bacterium]
MNLSLEAAQSLVIRALVVSGVSPATAAIVAAALVAAEADGLIGHGLARLPAYADQAVVGKVKAIATPVLRRTAPGALMVDADGGFAYPAIIMGLKAAEDIVRDMGVVGLGIVNSHHFGAAGYHIEPLANRGLMALAFSNAPASIAPWGGTKSLFGTNPIAFACPSGRDHPLVIDLSISKVARGKLMVAVQRNEPIPEGWALDPDGKPTQDAKVGLAGTMIPMGDAKGAALALMVEILAAGLTGANFGYEASSFLDAEGSPPLIGQFFLIIDPQRFGGASVVPRIAELGGEILKQQGTRLPGSRRLEMRTKAQAEGITIPDALYKEIEKRAERVTPP